MLAGMVSSGGVVMSSFAHTIYQNKYAHSTAAGKETWPETAERVAKSVMGGFLPGMVAKVQKYITERKLMPGGRYLYAAGRRFPQISNCFLMKAEDSREGWGSLCNKSANALMTGGGIGVVYSDIRSYGLETKGMGGIATGPCSLMGILNEQGRRIMQGGSRRSAIWAGVHWWHPDIPKYIRMKNWSEIVKQAKAADFNFPGEMDMTNISVILDDDFFTAYSDPNWRKTYQKWGTSWSLSHTDAQRIYWDCVKGMLTAGEPGFSIDIGKNGKENLRNAPVHGDTKILTSEGYQKASDLAGEPATIWTGKQWAKDVVFQRTGEMVPTVRVLMTGGREIICDPSHPFLVDRYKGKGKGRSLVETERIPASELEEGDIISVSLPQPEITKTSNIFYTLGFIYGDGSFMKNSKADLTVCSPTKVPCIERFSSLSYKVEKDGRGYQRFYFQSHPILENRTKEEVPEIKDPNAIASFIAGLFDADGNALPSQNRIRLSSVRYTFLQGVSRMLESLGILAGVSKGGGEGLTGFGGRPTWQLVVNSDYTRRFTEIIPTLRVKLNLGDYEAYRKSTVKIISVESGPEADVYCADVGVSEHSFQAEGVLVSNCTEAVSEDDCDNCNLASLNLARIESKDEFEDVMEAGISLLICGTMYGKLPMEEMYKVREKNRRLGLGLMGLHEWLLMRGMPYGESNELARWLEVYATSTEVANRLNDRLSISHSVATRSVAPVGTISIVAETTSGIEPIMAAAYKRRYLDGTNWKAQYVVDASAQRIVEKGVDPELIEDSLTLADDIERRMRFQAWVQSKVDQGISSTLNIPAWGSSLNNENTVKKFGDTLFKYLPSLRGITTYPDGSRGGQPITRVPYSEAINKTGVEFVDNSEASCNNGVCGS